MTLKRSVFHLPENLSGCGKSQKGPQWPAGSRQGSEAPAPDSRSRGGACRESQPPLQMAGGPRLVGTLVPLLSAVLLLPSCISEEVPLADNLNAPLLSDPLSNPAEALSVADASAQPPQITTFERFKWARKVAAKDEMVWNKLPQEDIGWRRCKPGVDQNCNADIRFVPISGPDNQDAKESAAVSSPPTRTSYPWVNDFKLGGVIQLSQPGDAFSPAECVVSAEFDGSPVTVGQVWSTKYGGTVDCASGQETDAVLKALGETNLTNPSYDMIACNCPLTTSEGFEKGGCWEANEVSSTEAKYKDAYFSAVLATFHAQAYYKVSVTCKGSGTQAWLEFTSTYSTCSKNDSHYNACEDKDGDGFSAGACSTSGTDFRGYWCPYGPTRFPLKSARVSIVGGDPNDDDNKSFPPDISFPTSASGTRTSGEHSDISRAETAATASSLSTSASEAGVLGSTGFYSEDEAGIDGALAGDFDLNHDGIPDLALASPTQCGPGEVKGNCSGVIHIIYGTSSPVIRLNEVSRTNLGGDAGPHPVTLDQEENRLSLELLGPAPNSLPGAAMVSADIDQDGYRDLVIGAPGVLYSSDPRSYSTLGEVFVLFGGTTTPTTTLTLDEASLESAGLTYVRLVSNVPGDGLGSYLTPGNLDGDTVGYPELLVAAPGATRNDTPEKGRIYMMEGRSLSNARGTTLDVIYAKSLWFESAAAGQPSAVLDFNGDHFADIALANPTTPGGSGVTGAVQLWLGSSNGFGAFSTASSRQVTRSPDFQLLADKSGSLVTARLQRLADVSGDGIDELVIGAPDRSSASGLVKAGMLWMVPGHPLTPGTSASLPGASNAAAYALEGEVAYGTFALDLDGAEFGGEAWLLVSDPAWDSPNCEGDTTGSRSGLGRALLLAAKPESGKPETYWRFDSSTGTWNVPVKGSSIYACDAWNDALEVAFAGDLNRDSVPEMLKRAYWAEYLDLTASTMAYGFGYVSLRRGVRAY